MMSGHIKKYRRKSYKIQMNTCVAEAGPVILAKKFPKIGSLVEYKQSHRPADGGRYVMVDYINVSIIGRVLAHFTFSKHHTGISYVYCSPLPPSVGWCGHGGGGAKPSVTPSFDWRKTTEQPRSTATQIYIVATAVRRCVALPILVQKDEGPSLPLASPPGLAVFQ